MNLKNKTIVMTGATSGLGLVAAKHALKQGATLIVLYRNPDLLKGLEGLGDLVPIQADLSSIASIKNACEQIKSSYPQIDILANNAGLWIFGDRKVTKEGREMTFMVNVLAPWILIKSLGPLLDKSTDPRIINTASALHQGTINFEDIEYCKSYSGFKAYRQSKLALILMTRYLAVQHPKWAIVSQHPGVVSTSLGREGFISNFFFKMFGISPEKGAATLIHLMECDRATIKSGEYYVKSRLAKTTTADSKDMVLAERVVKYLEGVIW